MSEKLLVKMGLSTLERPMTRLQAERYGKRAMPEDLRRAGFETIIARSDPELHGGLWFRINYAKR